MRSLVKFIGESMFTCFMCPFTATIESSSSCKLEDHQGAWWQDFWGLPGSMMARPTCKKGSVRPGSVSSSSSSVTLRCLAIMITRSELHLPMSLIWRSCLPPSLPFSGDLQIAEPPNPLLQMSLSWFLFKTIKITNNLPGYEVFILKYSKARSYFFPVACYSSEMNIGELHKCIYANKLYCHWTEISLEMCA